MNKKIKAITITILCVIGYLQFFVFVEFWALYGLPVIGGIIVLVFIISVLCGIYDWAIELIGKNEK